MITIIITIDIKYLRLEFKHEKSHKTVKTTLCKQCNPKNSSNLVKAVEDCAIQILCNTVEYKAMEDCGLILTAHS